MRDLTALIQGKYKPLAVSTLRLSSAAVSAKTIARTPVDSGSLRASWTPNNGGPIARNVNITANGGSRVNNIAAVTNSLQLGDTYSFSNGQPYAMRIEYEGWSDQAPAGMRDVSVAEWGAIVAAAVRSGG